MQQLISYVTVSEGQFSKACTFIQPIRLRKFQTVPLQMSGMDGGVSKLPTHMSRPGSSYGVGLALETGT